MKAVTSASAQASPAGPVLASGRVHRHPRTRDLENEEIQVYISKLKELVPFMPKNRKLSKLEVIQYVIDYICDLQEALESQPARLHPGQASPRQPLGVLAPNTLPTSCSTQEASTAPVHLLEKVSTPADTRPVSC